MKRIMFYILVLAVLLTFCGCGIASNETTTVTTEGANSVFNGNEVPTLQEFSIPETNIIDTSNFRVTVKGVEEGYINLLYENFSELPVEYTTSLVSANGYYIESYDWFEKYDRLPANDKAEDSVEINKLLELGIRSVDELQIRCVIRRGEDDILFDESYTFDLSVGIESEDDLFWRSLENGEYAALTNETIEYLSNDTLYDQGGIKINTVAISKHNLREVLYIELENTRTEECTIYIENIAINGLFFLDSTSVRIPENMRRLFKINLWTWGDSTREKFNIQETAEVTFCIRTNHDYENNTEISIQIPERQNKIDTSGLVIYDSTDVKVVHKGIYSEQFPVNRISFENYDYKYYYSILFYVENKGESELCLKIDPENFFLNYEKTPLMGYPYLNIPAGYCGYMEIETDYESAEINEPNNVDDIEEIELNLTIENTSNWDEYSERISYSVK